jgi:hypothetical protein
VVLMDSPPAVPGAEGPDPGGPGGEERVEATSLLSYALRLRRDMVEWDALDDGVRGCEGSWRALACMSVMSVSEAGQEVDNLKYTTFLVTFPRSFSRTRLRARLSYSMTAHDKAYKA